MTDFINEPGSLPFGGDWSQQKLLVLSKYLGAYTTALQKQPYSLIYIDAFAGAGKVGVSREHDSHNQSLLEERDDQEKYRHGSPLVALATTPSFDKFIFVDKSKKSLNKLEQQILENNHAHKSIEYMHGDANDKLVEICREVNWRSYRAVAFLDPFATEVEWRTIEAIAKTKAVDLWLLFPAMAVNRMMNTVGEVSAQGQAKLTKCFGTDEWKQVFYKADLQLFDDAPDRKVMRPFEVLSKFVNDRLKSIFPGVARQNLILKNSRNSPLFLLCFACSNPRAVKLALRLANHIIDTSP